MRFFRAIKFNDPRKTFESVELFREQWRSVRKSPEHEISPIGIIRLPCDDDDHSRILHFFDSFRKIHPLYISFNTYSFDYNDYDLDQLEIFDLLPGMEIELKIDEVSQYFDVELLCDQCRRSNARQKAPFRLGRNQKSFDFGEVFVIDDDLCILGWIMSKRCREFFESLGSDISFEPVYEHDGRISDEYAQLHIHAIQPLAPSNEFWIGPICEKCGQTEGVYRQSAPEMHDLCVSRDAFKCFPIARTGTRLGRSRYVCEAHEKIIVPGDIVRRFWEQRFLRCGAWQGFLVPTPFHHQWGGVTMFNTEKLEGGDWEKLFQARLSSLEAVLGPSDEKILHAPVPLHFGGFADVLKFPKYTQGICYVTSDLIGNRDQNPNSLGQYELAMITHEEDPWAADIISRLARYTLETVLKPGETMDIQAAAPPGSSVAALLFISLDGTEEMPPVLGKKAGVLLAMGITKEELAECRQEGWEATLERLRDKDVYPYTSHRR